MPAFEKFLRRELHTLAPSPERPCRGAVLRGRSRSVPRPRVEELPCGLEASLRKFLDDALYDMPDPSDKHSRKLVIKLEKIGIQDLKQLFDILEGTSLNSRLAALGEKKVDEAIIERLLSRMSDVREQDSVLAGENRRDVRDRARSKSRSRVTLSLEDAVNQQEASLSSLYSANEAMLGLLSEAQKLESAALERERAAERQSADAVEKVAAAERRARQAEGEAAGCRREVEAEVDERRKAEAEAAVAEGRARSAQERERLAEGLAGQRLGELEEATGRLEGALADAAAGARAEAVEAAARELAEALRVEAEEAAAEARRLAGEASERAEAAEALVGADVLALLASEEESCQEAELRADELRAQCEAEAEAAQRMERAGEARQEQLQRAEHSLEKLAGRSAELRVEAAELQGQARAEAARCAAAEAEAAAAGELAEEERERRAEALDEAQAASEEARAASEEASELHWESRVAAEDAEESREMLQEALRREEQVEREEAAEAQALLSELAARRRAEEVLASSEERLAAAEAEALLARHAAEEAEVARAEAAEALELQRALREEADARSEQLREQAEAAKRRAEDSELGQEVRALECEAEAQSETGRRLEAELERQRARTRKHLRGIDRAVRALTACRGGGSDSSDESTPAEGDAQSLNSRLSSSWSVVSQAAEAAQSVSVHSLPMHATVLNDRGQEIEVKNLEKGMRLKSIKSVDAKWEDDLDFDEVIVRKVRGSRRHEFSLVRCSVQEDPNSASSRGQAIELTADYLVLAKRRGVGAWLPTEASDLKVEDDDFTLLLFDELERDPLVEVKSQQAESRLKHMEMLEFELEDPDGVIFASTDGGPLLALCGTTSDLDRQIDTVEFMRNTKALHTALDEHPCLRACRRAIEAKGYTEPIHPSGAKIFVLPSMVDPLLKALEVEGANDSELRSHHVVTSRRLAPFVEAAGRSLPSSARVKLRRGATRAVAWQQVQAAEDYHAIRANAPSRDMQGQTVHIRSTFLEVGEAPSESSQPHTVSTTYAHIGPAANPRVIRRAA